MSHSLPEGEAGFFALNSEWQYLIQPANPKEFVIRFDHQKDGSWLAHKRGTEEIRVMTEATVIKALNEALDQGLTTAAYHPHTKELILVAPGEVSKVLKSLFAI